MPSRGILLTGAVKAPVCSRAAEHSKKAASLDVSELNNLAILTKREAASLLRVTPATSSERLCPGVFGRVSQPARCCASIDAILTGFLKAEQRSEVARNDTAA